MLTISPNPRPNWFKNLQCGRPGNRFFLKCNGTLIKQNSNQFYLSIMETINS